MLVSYRRLIVWAYHAVVIALCFTAAFYVRFEFAIPPSEVRSLLTGLLLVVPVKLVILSLFRLDRGWWRYTSMSDAVRMFAANAAASAVLALLLWVEIGPAFPRSVYVIDFLLCALFTGGTRVVVRIYNDAFRNEIRGAEVKRVLIYGACSEGITLLREIKQNRTLGMEVAGIISDDVRTVGLDIMGVPILGRGCDLKAVVKRLETASGLINEVIIAMPAATSRDMREAVAACRNAGVKCRTLPALSELLSSKFLGSQIREIRLEDLLGREPANLDEVAIAAVIQGNNILVTGAAGSIGSELCRQIASYRPGRLVALDQSESELFYLDRDLRARFPDIEIVDMIADVRDPARLDEVLQRCEIDTIFHAAAYKHVPLMETHALEAIRNNVFGTTNLVRAACRHRVSRFVLVSSDKAVNPTNIMGATKRVAEMVVSAIPQREGVSGQKFVSVRFGNVLGSRGSVVPSFQAQIAAGGPVTVTHPEVERYFMSLREAAQLVLQASCMGLGGEIFVLDMGAPVRITDLAKNMIRLSGLEPDRDIEICYTGLRPGEKLFEELSNGHELLPTSHEKVRLSTAEPVPYHELVAWLNEMKSLLGERDELSVVQHLAKVVEGFSPSTRWNQPSEVLRAAAGAGPREHR